MQGSGNALSFTTHCTIIIRHIDRLFAATRRTMEDDEDNEAEEDQTTMRSHRLTASVSAVTKRWVSIRSLVMANCNKLFSVTLCGPFAVSYLLQ